jgi:lipopolysaccharide transport system ATP-binding protein
MGGAGVPRSVITRPPFARADRTARGPDAGARRDWSDPTIAPGNDAVRMRSVRVRTREGQTTGTVDIRRPVGIELTYDVLEGGHVLIPNFHVVNQDGLHLFAVQDVASEWRRQPRPVGQYTSTAWIPGNFLAAGKFTIDLAVSTHVPAPVVHAFTPQAVTFQVLDHFDGDAVRGDYIGEYPGVVRPMVDWTTHFEPIDEPSDVSRRAMTTA